MKNSFLIIVGVIFFTMLSSKSLEGNEVIVEDATRIEEDLGNAEKESIDVINVSMIKDNDIQDKGILNKDKVSTKSQYDFGYLSGFNLTNATYLNQTDKNRYQSYFQNNEFIPQGLTMDKDGNLLISMYHMTGYWVFGFYLSESLLRSIVVKYDPDEEKILNVLTLNDMPVGDHVGGIGYHYEEHYDGTFSEFIFIQNQTYYVRVYKAIYVNPSVTPLRINYLRYQKSYLVDHAASVISSSHDYLWVANYVDNGNNKYLTGYKITYYGTYDDVFLIKKYKVKQPKKYLQGLYCDSDPELEDRLKFYFTASANISYVYQAVLAKDSYSDGFVDDVSEYYWESYYTPYGYNSGPQRKLPDGGEGIVIRENKLYMLNEGASDYYCGAPSWDDEDIDCAREILIVNPVKVSNNDREVFPSGSIEITGTDISNYGHKVVIVLAQNKKGKLYYSVGEFECVTGGSCKLFVLEPSTPNPVGKQYNFFISSKSLRPIVFMEDIVGIYFMNLSEQWPNTSDDFYMNQIKFTFDENYYLLGDNDPYTISEQISTLFGDNTNDKDTMEFYFQFKYDGWDKGVKYYNPSMYQDIFDSLDYCYSSGTPKKTCRNNALDDMEDYIDNDEWWFLYYRINWNISRLYDIEL